MFVNTTCPDFQQQYRLKFSQYLRNYSCRPSGYHISKVELCTAVQYFGAPKTLTSLTFAAWMLCSICVFHSHHRLLEMQGSIAAAIIVIIIAIAACGLATFFLMRMRSRRMNQVRSPLLLTL